MKKTALFIFCLFISSLNFGAHPKIELPEDPKLKASIDANLQAIRRKVDFVTRPIPASTAPRDTLEQELYEKFSAFSPLMRQRIADCMLSPAACKDFDKSTINTIKRVMEMMDKDKKQQEAAHFKDQNLATRTKDLARACAQGAHVTDASCDDLDKLPKNIVERELAELKEEQSTKKTMHVTTFPMGMNDSQAHDQQTAEPAAHNQTANDKLTPEEKAMITKMIQDGTLKITAEFEQVAKLCAQIKKDNKVLLDAEQQRQQEREVERAGDRARAMGDGLSFIARAFGTKEDARKLKAFGKEVKTAIKGCYAVASGDVLIGSMAMAGAVESLIDAFDEQDAAPDQLAEVHHSILAAIEEAIKILSERMMLHTREIIGEVHDIKQLIGENRGEMMFEFFKIHQNAECSSAQMQTIKNHLMTGQDTAQATMHQANAVSAVRHGEVSSLFAEMPIRQIDMEHHDFALQVDQELSAELFLNIVKKYHSFIKILASSGSLTGSHVTQENLQRMAEALEGDATSNISKHPAFGNIDLLARMHEKFLGETLPQDLKDGISNPLVLLKCLKQLTGLVDTFEKQPAENLSFEKQSDKDFAIKLLQEISTELSRGQQTVAWLVMPNKTQKALTGYKDSVQNLQTKLDACFQKDYLQKTGQEIKNRLKDTVAAELAALSYMIPPAFPKLRSQIIAFDGSMHVAIEAVRDNVSGRPWISRSVVNPHTHNPVVQCAFSENLAAAPGIEAEAKRDDIVPYIDEIMEQKKNHWYRVRKDLKERIEAKLTKNLTHIDDTLMTGHAQKLIGTVQSLVYPSQTDAYHLPLISPAILQAPERVKLLVALGKGGLRYTYAVTDKKLIISGWFLHNDTEKKVYEWTSPEHTEPLQTDEDLYHFWYGGRFSRDDNDSVTVKFGQSASHHSHHYMAPMDEPRRVIATHRYPSTVEHDGKYKVGPLGQMELFEDANDQAVYQTSIDKALQEKRFEMARDAVQELDNHATDLGKLGQRCNIFYALLCSSLALHDGTLQPNLSIAQRTPHARNSTELRQFLRTNPESVHNELKQIASLCDQSPTFPGPHKLIEKQTSYLNKLRATLAFLAGAQVKTPMMPRQMSNIPDDFMQLIMQRLAQIEAENENLAAQNGQMLKLLTEMQDKK
ncbi:hypothetical protein A3J41_03405 [candidate division TM6 bacterium RIFCSPHIGHO2_12_FULL_38_8]|nr:MAG: hypothetical protein A3J41_03405 [candidate division TM6 bacterium RIFCSPHIGHO2_12_FULL_38_8]